MSTVEIYRMGLSCLCLVMSTLYLSGLVDPKKIPPYALILLALGALLVK